MSIFIENVFMESAKILVEKAIFAFVILDGMDPLVISVVHILNVQIKNPMLVSYQMNAIVNQT